MVPLRLDTSLNLGGLSAGLDNTARQASPQSNDRDNREKLLRPVNRGDGHLQPGMVGG
jgi:hypothetical protein